MSNLPRAAIIFAGGGTGGHFYPAVAIADRVAELTRDRFEIDITFMGTKRGIEYRMRDKIAYPLELINIRGIVRSFTLKNLLVPFIVIGALIRALGLLKKIKPAVVVGTGGYVSWPILKAASIMNVPYVLQEQNSYPGLVTRQMSQRARCTFLGFESAARHLKSGTKTKVTGNPVRTTMTLADRSEAAKHFDLDQNKKTILIFGGSQGARALNKNILSFLQENELPDNVQLLWQIGKRDYKEVAAQAGSKATSCTLLPFVERMDLAYAIADIAIARAGALTLAELAACSVPSILVPYPYAAEDHQRHNAEDFVRQGTALLIDEKDLSSVSLIKRAVEAIASGERDSMAKAAAIANQNRVPAVDIIAEEIIKIVTERTGGEAGE